MSLPNILYTRSEDGSLPVCIETSQDGKTLFVCKNEKAGDLVFQDEKNLLLGVTGKRFWSFDRYFRQGKYRPRILQVADLPGNQPAFSSIFEIPFLTTEPTPRLVPQGNDISIRNTEHLGIDLVKRGHEVAKIFYAGFGNKLMAAGVDPEDVLQEVYRGILVRNRGECPWDPAKSSFGHYVHMVCSCIISNYFRHENRKNAMEQTGVVGRTSEGTLVDVASDDALLPSKGVLGPQEDLGVLKDLLDYVQIHGSVELRKHPEVLILMREGYNRIEIAQRTGLPTVVVSRVYKGMQNLVLQWSSI